MRTIKISQEKVEGIVKDYLRNIGYDVVEVFSHTHGIAVDVENEEYYDEFESDL